MCEGGREGVCVRKGGRVCVCEEGREGVCVREGVCERESSQKLH